MVGKYSVIFGIIAKYNDRPICQIMISLVKRVWHFNKQVTWSFWIITLFLSYFVAKVSQNLFQYRMCHASHFILQTMYIVVFMLHPCFQQDSIKETALYHQCCLRSSDFFCHIRFVNHCNPSSYTGILLALITSKSQFENIGGGIPRVTTQSSYFLIVICSTFLHKFCRILASNFLTRGLLEVQFCLRQ